MAEANRTFWTKCIDNLKEELPSQQFNTWIRPLQAQTGTEQICVFAPNRFIKDWVKGKYLPRIQEILAEQGVGHLDVRLDVRVSDNGLGGRIASAGQATVQTHERQAQNGAPALLNDGNRVVSRPADVPATQREIVRETVRQKVPQVVRETDKGNVDTIIEGKLRHRGALNEENNFDNFIVGKSNQLARAASRQVAENPGYAYNPLFIYGGVGLGKTHLMHAVGNYMVARKPGAKVVYLHSETFVATMVTALQLNAINEFKRFYRSVDALLIDDIQFFAGKERSQEEFFHTFNALLEGGQQIILTCDRYHKEINGLEERLKSRFGWGLTVAVEPPELETRAAILINKAERCNAQLPYEAALFIAQRLRSNVRELEGALKRVIAHANFKGERITTELIKEALRDLFALQDKLVSIDNIQRSVAEYYKIKMADMLSKRRNRSVARPRQVAMTLSKELTNHSLPEIGDAFGGRDHTTVLHACKQIKKLRHSSTDIQEDYNYLLRSLSS